MGGIAFGMGRLASNMPDRVDAVFSLSRNTFRGVTSLQTDVKAIQSVQSARMEALSRPHDEQEQAALLAFLLDAFSLQAGKEERGTESIHSCEWTELENALALRERGHLLVAHTSVSALHALETAELDVCRHAPDDPRGFASLLTEPLLSMNCGHWRHVWLLDGEMFAQEAERWLHRLPAAQIHILPRTQEVRALAQGIDAGDPAYRTLYKALRQDAHRTLEQLSQASGLNAVQTRAGLHAFKQLGLIQLSEAPFRYTLLTAPKCSLSDSPVLGALRRLHGAEKE